MSKEDQYAIVGKLMFERKEVREQITALEQQMEETGKILAEWGKQLEPPFEAEYRHSHPDDHQNLKDTVAGIGDLLERYRQAKAKDAELTETLRKCGVE